MEHLQNKSVSVMTHVIVRYSVRHTRPRERAVTKAMMLEHLSN